LPVKRDAQMQISRTHISLDKLFSLFSFFCVILQWEKAFILQIDLTGNLQYQSW